VDEPTEQPDTEFDLHLNNGRLLEHFHEGNLTYRVNGIRQKTPDTWVEVSPELAQERGIQAVRACNCARATGRGPRGALVTDRVLTSNFTCPMNSTESPSIDLPAAIRCGDPHSRV